MMQKAKSIMYAARLRVVGKYVGQLSIVLAALALAPLAVAILMREWPLAARYAIVAAGLACAGSMLARLKVNGGIQTNESLVITASMFLLSPLVMTYPMMAAELSFTDALFEAVSAVTTTGLSTLGTVEDKPATFLFARAWMQWYGGLGIVIFSLALVMRPGLTAKQLSNLSPDPSNLVGNTKVFARLVFIVYGTLTAAGLVACMLAGIRPFDALVHALSAVSTGGFSSYDQSLAALPTLGGRIVVLLACFSGAVTLSVYHRAARRGWRHLAGDIQFRALIAFCILAAAAMTLSLRLAGEMPWAQALEHGSMIAVSAQTTAGFSTTAIADLPPLTKLLTMLWMSIGGSVGSTAGGVKLLRVLIVLRMAQIVLRRISMPRHAVLEPRLGGHRVDDQEVSGALLMILAYAAAITLSWLAFVAYDYAALDSLFEVVSATGTVGLSTGVCSAELPPALKSVLIADMLLGRLEILALLILIYPPTWISQRRKAL